MYLTAAQTKAIAAYEVDQFIETQDEHGWIFVHATANKDDEGSGVWMDTDGNEHYGPYATEDRARRAAASE